MFKYLFILLSLSIVGWCCNNSTTEKGNPSTEKNATKKIPAFLEGTWKQKITPKPETEKEKEEREQEQRDRSLVDNHEDHYIVFKNDEGDLSVYRRSTIEEQNELGEHLKITADEISFRINGFVNTTDKYILKRNGDGLTGGVEGNDGEKRKVSLIKMEDGFKIPYKERSY